METMADFVVNKVGHSSAPYAVDVLYFLSMPGLDRFQTLVSIYSGSKNEADKPFSCSVHNKTSCVERCRNASKHSISHVRGGSAESCSTAVATTNRLSNCRREVRGWSNLPVKRGG